MVSMCCRVQINWFSGRTLQPSIVLVVADIYVPLDFLVEGHVSGTVLPVLTLSFFSTWLLPLRLVFFILLFCVQSHSAIRYAGRWQAPD